jgi:flagellar hook protein FlgE
MASFSIALSGLTAASSDLDLTSNNIANADTVGFKQSRAEFADVYAAGAVSLNTGVAGEGVRVASTPQQFDQGPISSSSANLDLAISGDGFFTLKNSSGTVYSRNGQFAEDSTGNVVSSTGAALQVYPPVVGGTGGFNTGTLSDLNLQTAQSAPLPTTTANVILNLPAGSTPPAAAAGVFDPTKPLTYTESTSTTVYDSLGAALPATFYFVATAAAATAPPTSTWTVYTRVNGDVATSATESGQTLVFNDAGAVNVPAASTLTFAFSPIDGSAAPQNIAVNFGATTQYGAAFGVTAITQNGYATGQLSTVAIDPTGIVSAVYTNGRSTELGQLALANFPNEQGLKQLGDTNWSQTFTSGDVVQGTAGSASFGSIQSGALEGSNVDLTTQLVNMITAQRAFDANAQVITTANQESQTVIAITH